MDGKEKRFAGAKQPERLRRSFRRTAKKRGIRRGVSLLLGALLLGIALQFPADVKAAVYYTQGPEIYGEAYCVLDADTGEIICAKNATAQYYPASITKVLTALVVLEQVEDLDAKLTFSQAAASNITADSSTLTPAAQAGETMSVRDALYGLLLVSGNECANALAEYTAQNTEAFAALMNARAQEIGVQNSHFTNPHGLQDADHYSCAYDMALIFAEALKNETFLEIDSTVSYTIGETNLSGARVLTMGHQMVTQSIPYEGVYAGKTGRTAYAGRTLLTAASYHGRNIVVAVMKSTDECVYLDTEILLDYTYGVIDGEPAWEWQETTQSVWAVGNVNMRELPTTHSLSLGTLLAGQEATRTAYCKEWSKLELDGREFYVATAYLTTNPDGTPEETETLETESESELESETETAPEETEPLETESGTEEAAAAAAADTAAPAETDGASASAAATPPSGGNGDSAAGTTRQTTLAQENPLKLTRLLPAVGIGVFCGLCIVLLIIYFIREYNRKKRLARLHRQNLQVHRTDREESDLL